jgi:predicted ester cyclase
MDGMIKRTALLLTLLVAIPACGKKDKDKDKNKPAPPTPKVTTPTPKEPPPGPKMTGQDLAKKYQDCWGWVSAKDWDKFKTCYAADATSEWLDSGMPPMKGADEILDKGAKPFVGAFSDWKGVPQLIMVGGNRVFSIAHSSGTHDGTLKSPKGDIPKTGKKVGYLVAHGVVFNDKGEATQEWFLQDFGTLMFQLGLAPGPGRAATAKGWAETPEVVIAAETQTADKVPAQVAAFTDAFNKHDETAVDALAADDMAQFIAPMPVDAKGKKAAIANAKWYWTAFPDVTLTVDSVLSAGDYTVAVGSATGTNTGPMPPQVKKPTGKKATVKTIQFAKWKDGKVAAEWVFFNGAALAEQLGLVPPK